MPSITRDGVGQNGTHPLRPMIQRANLVVLREPFNGNRSLIGFG
ncbi:hypothetical protein [Ascidiaceihabitans sp.]